MSNPEERRFHNIIYEHPVKNPAAKPYVVVDRTTGYYYDHFIRPECGGKIALEYGCGKGSYAFRLSEENNYVVGIDISEVGIKFAASEAGMRRMKNLQFVIMDAEETGFKDGSFDIVCGFAILHHLDTERAVKEVARILKPYGKAYFIEPLGYNPVINIFRRMTPWLRTKNEHPLKRRDLLIIEKYFGSVNYSFFHLLTFLSVPFQKTAFFSRLFNMLINSEKALFRCMPFLKLFAWQVVMVLAMPKKEIAA